MTTARKGRSSRHNGDAYTAVRASSSSTTTKKTRTPRQSKRERFGLLANGSCGSWEIAIDENTNGPDRWLAQLDGPSVTFCFELPSLDIVAKMTRLLEPGPAGSPQGSAPLVIGKDSRHPVSLIRDDEYDDRFFLVVGPAASPIVRFVLAGADVTNIAGALRQIQDDLDDQD